MGDEAECLAWQFQKKVDSAASRQGAGRPGNKRSIVKILVATESMNFPELPSDRGDRRSYRPRYIFHEHADPLPQQSMLKTIHRLAMKSPNEQPDRAVWLLIDPRLSEACRRIPVQAIPSRCRA